MVNSPKPLCRKCLGFVSRSVSTIPAPPASGRGGVASIPENTSKCHNVAASVAIVVSLVALIGIIVYISVLLRRQRIREQELSRTAPSAPIAPYGAAEDKDGDGEAKLDKNGKWSTGTVELVVMAGETSATFIAHPVPALPVEQSPHPEVDPQH